MPKENIIKQENAIDFILGGNALFTVRSLKTGTRFTFKVLHDCHNKEYFKVYILNGSDNTKNYKQIGYINILQPTLHSVSVHLRDTPAFKAFDYIYLNLCVKFPMPSLEIWHEGRCCRCGRILTVPESIAMGIGPECVFK